MGILEIMLGIVSLITSVLLFLVGRQNKRMDRMESELKAHEVSDASTLITRVETDSKMETLKKDIRDIIHPLSEAITRIEGYLIAHPKQPSS
jgi:hypothetical protein